MKIKNLKRHRVGATVNKMPGNKAECKTCQRKIDVNRGAIIPQCGICNGKLCRIDHHCCANTECAMNVCEDDMRHCARCDADYCRNCIRPAPARKANGERVYLCIQHREAVQDNAT